MLREMFLAWARSVLLRPAFEQWKEALRVFGEMHCLVCMRQGKNNSVNV